MKKVLCVTGAVLAAMLMVVSCNPQGNSAKKPVQREMKKDKSQPGCPAPCPSCDTCPDACDTSAATKQKSPEQPKSAAQTEAQQKAPVAGSHAEKSQPAVSEAPQKEALPIVKEEKRTSSAETAKTSQTEMKNGEKVSVESFSKTTKKETSESSVKASSDAAK